MAKSETDVLAVGHFCHDLLIGRGTSDIETLGGSMAYGPSILGALGIDYRIASKVGEDFKYFSKCAKPPTVAPGFKTTSFIDDHRVDNHRGGERRQIVSAVCESILPQDIDVAAKVAVICGVINEIPVETILAVAERSPIVLCDIQGLIRAVGPGGALQHVPLRETPFHGLMDRFTAVKVSRSEAPFVDLEELRKKTLVLLTEDDKGCTVLDAHDARHFPTQKIQPLDSTGAGDCFLAGFAYGFLNDIGLERSAQFANFCGGLAVRHVGVPELSRGDFVGQV
jgi:1D-myo-inositol 3-kinase